MSTIDPAEVRRQRQQSKVGSTRALVPLLIGDLMVCGGAVVFARAMYGFTELDAEGPPLAVLVGQPVGILAIIFGSFVHAWALRSYTGRPIGPTPFLGIVPLEVIGGAAGAWWGWLVTGSGSIIVPGALSGLAVVILVLTAVRRAARRAQLNHLAELMRTGQLTTGIITEIPEIGPSSGGLLGTVTVKFTDPWGTERWVTKSGQWRRADLPKNGDPALVLYDPRDPGNEKSIWLGPPGPQRPADFVHY